MTVMTTARDAIIMKMMFMHSHSRGARLGLASFVGSLLALAACGPDGPPASSEGQTEDTHTDDTTQGTESEDTQADDTTEDTGPSCQPQPDVCARFLACIAVLTPDQTESLEQLYGEEGSCWCEDEAAHDACVTTCSEQIADARVEHPTEPACQLESCPIEELDPSQPYGPVVDGECPEYNFVALYPLIDPAGLSGSTCGYPCGIADICPDHSQTSAESDCLFADGDASYCALRCYVDPNVQPGAQCPCGARCQPLGGPDDEGHLRGVCLFE